MEFSRKSGIIMIVSLKQNRHLYKYGGRRIMFNQLREYARSWWFKAILLSIVLSFVGTIFWIWGRGNVNPLSRVIAWVDDEGITIREFNQAYNNLYKFYSKVYNELTPEILERLNLRELALDQLIQKKLVLEQARVLGLRFTDQELIDWIKGIPAFQNDQGFNPNRYYNVLRTLGIDSQTYESEQGELLLLRKVEALLKDSIKVSEAELKQAYAYEKEEIEVEYALLKPEIFLDKAKAGREELEDYYERVKESYRRPATVRVEYVLFRPEQYLGDIKVSEEEIEDSYRENRSEYWRPQRIRARHILLKLPPDPSPEEERRIKEKAEGLIKKLKEGQDFAELAKKYSEDPATAKNGGDLGYFLPTEMVAPFRNAVLELKKGEISPPVRTPYGYHIIKVEDIQEAHILSLDEVREEIRQRLAKEKARRYARIKAGQFLKMASGGGSDLAQLAKDFQLKLHQTDFFSQDQLLPEIPSYKKFIQVAFRLEPDQLSSPILTKEGYYILRLIERKPSYIPTLEEVKKEVEAKLLKEKARELAMKKLKEMETQAREKGSSLKELVKPLGLKVEKSGFFTRKKDLAPIISDSVFIKAAFSITKEGEIKGVEAPEGGYLIRLLKRKGIDEEAFEKEKEEFRRQFLQRRKQQVYTAWLDHLRHNAKIEINPELF